MNKAIIGFSKLSKEEKINWIASTYFTNPEEAIFTIKKYWNENITIQKIINFIDQYYDEKQIDILLKY